MAKEQQRSNREAKKQKAAKKPPPSVRAKPYQLPVKAAPGKEGRK
jgi:hypothetical protein